MAEDSESEPPSGAQDGDAATGEGGRDEDEAPRGVGADAEEPSARDDADAASDAGADSDAEVTEDEADSETATDADSETATDGEANGDSDDADDDVPPGIDPETDRLHTDQVAPVTGSIDPDLIPETGPSPGGDTGSDDPVPKEEREPASEAVGSSIPKADSEDAESFESSLQTDAPEETVDGETVDGEAADGATTADVDAEYGPEEAAAATIESDTPPAPTPSDATVEDDDWADGLVGEGPASDQEMPLAEHIEEMVKRLAVVLVIGGVVGLAVFPVSDRIINFLWDAHIPGAETVAGRRPRLYGPLELLLTQLKVSALAGFVVGLPVAVYETYLFMRPGLFPHERRYYLAAVPTSLVLAFVGVAFAHFVVLPAIFAYFTAYTTGTAVIAFGLKETFGLILVLMGYMALVFQIPLFIMLAIMMNLTSRVWLEDKRLLFWGGFLGVSFLISPDPTGMAPIIVAATMISLFEGTLLLLRWTGN